MSVPSGIKVTDELKSSFASAQTSSDTRALVFIIDGESFKLHTTVNIKGSYKDDVAQLPTTLPSSKTPASFAYRLDTMDMGKYEWMMITFVPDDAGVRAKMLQASSRSGLLKALGANNFKHDWFATSLKDLTPSSLNAHLSHIASPPPLSASEAALAQVREAEAEEAKRTALDPEAEMRRRKAVVGLGGKFKWGTGVGEALNKVGERSDDGWIVCLEIPASDPGAISLLTSESCSPSQVASKLPVKSPCYAFYSYPTPPPATPAVLPVPSVTSPVKASSRDTFQATQGGARPVAPSSAHRNDAESTEAGKREDQVEETGNGKMNEENDETGDNGETGPTVNERYTEEATTPAPAPKTKGRVLFMYTCPSGSPIKFRMVYSSGVRGMQQDAMDKANVEIAGKLETSDVSDVTDSYLKSALPPTRPTHSTSLPTPSTTTSNTAPFAGMVGAQPTPFGGAFGRPRPTPTKIAVRSATQIPLPASEGPSTPVGGVHGEESQDGIRKAFDAFGPRVNASSGGGGSGFARPRPAGRR